MRFDVITLFPEMFEGVLGQSILGRAREAGLIAVNLINPRDFTSDRHRIVDDYPFGGGPGMVMKPEPLFLATEYALETGGTLPEERRVILTCPGGARFNQQKAIQLATCRQIVLICGHYEGVDERVRLHLADEAISIGDFVLTGGEIPAMAIIDAVSRLLPGVLGAADGALRDSFAAGLLEYPQYTRPRNFRGWEVPEVLLSGDHARIERWRRKQALKNTWQRRPDLFETMVLSDEDRKMLAEIQAEETGV